MRYRSPSRPWARRGPAAVAVFAVLAAAATAFGSVLGDVELDRLSTKNGVPAVLFPHWKHRSRFKCYVCHPAPFEMRAGANDINMDAIRAGEQCGMCHNGRVAFAAGFETCRSCHSVGEPPGEPGAGPMGQP